VIFETGRRPARVRRLVWVGLLLLVCGGTRAAWAASRVVLLRSLTDDALSRQGTTLLTAELEAAGFEVVEIERDSTHDIRQDIDAASARLQPVATFAIRSLPGRTAVELWLEDRITGKLVIRRVAVRAGSSAAAPDLALKAVELLRGSLLEVTVQGRDADGGQAAASPPGEVTRFVASAAPDRLDHFAQGVGFAAGGTALASPRLAPTFAPVLRLSWGRRSGYLGRLTASGLGSSPTVTASEGEARVHETLFLLEGLRVFRGRRRLQPVVGFGAGALLLRSEGTANSPLGTNLSGTTSTLVVAASGGLAARLTNRLAVMVDVSLLLLARPTTIRIATNDAGRAGPAAFMATASLCGAF
jgi:hypothetical protein